MGGGHGFLNGPLRVGLIVALIFTAACSSESGLTFEDFDKLELGMPVSEAESILGLTLEDVKETDVLGLPLTTGRFGPADGSHIALIAQDTGSGLEIRQLEWVEDGESVCVRGFDEDTCPDGG